MTQDYTFRPINLETDFDTYYALYREEYIESFGGFNMSEDEVRGEFDIPKFNPETDTFGAFTADGTLVGSALFFAIRELNVRPSLYGFVHPDHRENGIGTRFMQWGIERAKQLIPTVPDDARVVLQGAGLYERERQLLEDNGFINTRQSHSMKIEFASSPPEVTLPDGMTVLTYAEHDVLEDFARIQQATFRDHRGAVDEPLSNIVARWKTMIDSTEVFNPELLFLVREGDADVGFVFAWPSSEEAEDTGYIDMFGIMPDYRRRGLGLKLLNYAFGELYKRGIHKAALTVDGSSLTGATRLYEKAGMHIDQVHYVYEHEIRAGKEYTNQG